jgi:hypothetical protein
MTDTFDSSTPGLTSPLERGFAVTPHDTNALSFVTRELFIGTGGNIALELKHGDSITLNNVPDGARLPYRVSKLLATGTTASDIVGLY